MKRGAPSDQQVIGDDEFFTRLAAAHQARHAQMIEHGVTPESRREIDGRNGRLEDDEFFRNTWPEKIEARHAETTRRLTGGTWTWQGDELVRAH